MHAEYEATIDEIADATLRAQSRSRVARRWYWQQVIWTGLLTGLVVFLLIPEPLPERLLYVAIGVIVGAGGLALTYRKSQMKRLRKYFREQFQGDGPLHFSVDVQPGCISAEQGGVKIIHN